MSTRYRLTITLLLAALLSGGNAAATGVTVHGSVFGGGNEAKVGTDATVNISSGTIIGDVFGGGNEASVNINTSVIISAGAVEGNVYGGGNLGGVGTHTDTISVGNYNWTANTGLSQVTISGGTIGIDEPSDSTQHGNVFGGGKGEATTFECEKGMVYQTNVTIDSTGTVVKGNVYGGGMVSRVENNTVVVIGTEGKADEPTINGSVFGAGAGIETHGYSALVRGTSTVTVQGSAKVKKNVYGGGELASVGRYKVKTPANKNDDDVPKTLPYGMPARLIDGGTSTVIIQGSAVIGTDNAPATGHVYGAGKGLVPRLDYDYSDNDHKPKRMISGNGWEYFADTTAYLQFVETLALSAQTDVTITGSATIKGSVFGGSENGFVYHNTDVKIQNGTVNGSAFGGGRGIASYAEAGRVKGNTEIAISGGAVEGNVYGGGNLGDVGTINKSAPRYNYAWKNSLSNGNINVQGSDSINTAHNNTITGTNNNTGICNVIISGGTIGLESTDKPEDHGNVFGAGKGLDDTWWCEKAMVFATDVNITAGTVYGTVYGGGQIGRVEDDTKVTIGEGENAPSITGNVFGAGAGKHTHGYSALVRGNADVTVHGGAQIGGSVYGGGEIASVGRFNVVDGLPKDPQSGGTCTVTIDDDAEITGDVFGACKGVNPADITSSTDRKSMQLAENAPSSNPDELWSYYENDHTYIWRRYATDADYLAFLETLALTSNTEVTISGNATVNKSVYGGGQRGISLGSVTVNMTGGTVVNDIYGGGALANTNKGNWDDSADNYIKVNGLTTGTTSVDRLYTKTGNTYTPASGNAVANTDYYSKGAWADDNTTSSTYTTKVILTGGTVSRVFGGALGDDNNRAKVYGDILVVLNGTVANNGTITRIGNTKGCMVDYIFGANNLYGTPMGKVKVQVEATQSKVDENDAINKKTSVGDTPEGATNNSRYDVLAVYGGGNLSAYEPFDAFLEATLANKARIEAARTNVIINGCYYTSIKQVYGGGNAASVAAAHVQVNGTHEINEVFGGGNGNDPYTLDNLHYNNPGANVGYYNYTHWGSQTGAVDDPFEPIDNTDASTLEQRRTNYRYGSGIATTEIYGGLIHSVYGGSNSKGNISTTAISIYDDMDDVCPVTVDETYGGGKNAPMDGEIQMNLECVKNMPMIFGGAKNADVNSDIVLNITNGSYQKVFGGNNEGGAIYGSITVNIEERGCQPIEIEELYGGGYLAPYSIYGYEKDNNGNYKYYKVDENNQFTTDNNGNYEEWTTSDGNVSRKLMPLRTGDNPSDQPHINIISATSIGKVFGGGYKAMMVGEPHVNVNMKEGKILKKFIENDEGYDTLTIDSNGNQILPIGTIDTVYGGGYMATVVGSTYVEIGTGQWYIENDKIQTENADGVKYTYNASTGKWDYIDGDETISVNDKPAPGRNAAKITGSVYGGGDQADVTENTFVIIGASKEPDNTYASVAPGSGVITIGGNVFGGGKGLDDTFTCEKAMVGVDGAGAIDDNEDGNPDNPDGGTTVIIGNGTVNGTVYGGGEIGRVEKNTMVTIGIGDGVASGTPASAPEIIGDVFGAGKGVKTHGYSALVRGNPTVTIQGNAKVRGSVYGGGEIASVARYKVVDGNPVELANTWSGNCKVTVQGYAEIGPEVAMQMNNTTTGKPDDKGHVFGAGKGILAEVYSYSDDEHKPKRMFTGNTWQYFANDSAYHKFIETLALATYTDVTISGHALVKGSVYGGSENGIVKFNTNVTIEGDCQIGQGKNETGRHPSTVWESNYVPSDLNNLECDSWEYDSTSGAPYDIFASPTGTYDYSDKYSVIPADKRRASSEGGRLVAKDGHTYYGNVFGGGRGVEPYAPGLWRSEAGAVYGNTNVDITGGHILTNVYGGNELTNVAGKCTVNFGGTATLGVPRTLNQIKEHPVTCNLYGAGKGDQREFFNQETNVNEVEVEITGGKIYGSAFGGAEDGHVLTDVVMTISDTAYIGTTGTSYVDGNVFGGGRGFSGQAQTSGNVNGDIEVNIEGGTMLGSVYGGGRLASVGTWLANSGDPNYGNLREDDNSNTYGHITVNISDGIIGRDFTGSNPLPDGAEHSGNVFGGSMGRLTLLNGTINSNWPKMAQAKVTEVNISDDALIHRNVYGGGELGTVRDSASVNISGGNIRGYVFAGGYGSRNDTIHTIFTVKEPNKENPSVPADYDDNTYAFSPMQFAGCVGRNTHLNISGGYVRMHVYGGGEMASVGIMNCRVDSTETEPSAEKIVVGTRGSKYYYYKNMIRHSDETQGFALSWPYEFNYMTGFDGATHVNVTGGRIGAILPTDDPNTDNGDVYGGGKGFAGDYKDYVFCANVGSADVNINFTTALTPTNFESNSGNCITGAVYGGGENGHVMGDTKVTLQNGLIGHALYGGGSGKDKFNTRLLMIGATPGSTNPSDSITREVFSITAGKVFGNTTVDMSGGLVVRNVYGGGTYASVGKGNYAGGPDDYSTEGYGEKLSGQNIWDGSNDYSRAFLNSGKCTVIITGGTVGYIGSVDKDGIPYGNVFGGCRGIAAPNVDDNPRYLYCPEFFMGYVNETEVIIGLEGSTEGPDIFGSVYGGGQDGHVRRDANVTIYSGQIGKEYTPENQTAVGTSELSHLQWLHAGNVYGAGSGIGKYQYDFSNNGKTSTDANGNGIIEDDEVEESTYKGELVKEEYYSNSAGSVTRFTKVEIKGGRIHRNVYGGGSLASVGAPKIDQTYNEYIKNDPDHKTEVGKQTLNKVIISGGQIGDESSYDTTGTHVYGGMVYGGSRGSSSLDDTFSTALFDSVIVDGNAIIKGDVFGGGEFGSVRGSVYVTINGGRIEHDVYGGGALANTNTANWDSTKNSNVGGWADGMYVNDTTKYNTKVNLNGGIIGNAYGGALGDSVSPAYVFGDVTVTLDGASLPADTDRVEYDTVSDNRIVILKHGSVFGCNNINGTPKGKVEVNVLSTSNSSGKNTKDTDNKMSDRFSYYYDENGGHDYIDVAKVFGGGNAADYKPVTNQAPKVIVDGCSDVSVGYVYGGGNAAAVPATDVEVKGAYYLRYVFGGGFGAGSDNKGANVGYMSFPLDTTSLNKSEYLYGTGSGIGTTSVKLAGGYIDNVFGGSDTKGEISDSVSVIAKEEALYGCPLKVGSLYGGGRKATMNTNIITQIDCPSGNIANVYGGSEMADINGNVTLNILAGEFDEVFGGNRMSGNISGYITVNIEETEYGCQPIIIGTLYGGCDLAPYQGSANDEGYNITVNAKAFTRIGEIYGGSKGDSAKVIGNTVVNINQVKGFWADSTYNSVHIPDSIGRIGNVFGGGDRGKVIGNTVINICTVDSVGFITEPTHLRENPGTELPTDATDLYLVPVAGARITGNVYGGGNLADVTGNTYVNIGSKEGTGDTYTSVTFAPSTPGITIGGNVYGGGKGQADDFFCAKAMVGINNDGIDHPDGGTSVIIGNGTINGSVYGGGEIGRVEKNSKVIVGFGEGGTNTSAPVINGNLYGAGKGVATHGYSALLRGNPSVTVQGDAHVKGSVYGGGEIASVARYKVPQTTAEVAEARALGYNAILGVPYALKNSTSGYCTVIVRGHAVIGPDEAMQMPTNTGHVFGAGKGTLPGDSTFTNNAHRPKRMVLYNDTVYTNANSAYWEYADSAHTNVWEYYASDNEAYHTFIQSLALASQTDVTIGGNAFIKGSVYGGSQDGIVQYDTKVTIADNCQIGNGFNKSTGEGVNRPYTAAEWLNENPADFYECASWDYSGSHLPYDLYDLDANNKPKHATNGYTFYGNVFGGGSGYYPYKRRAQHELDSLRTLDPDYADGVWHRAAGLVRGNTSVNIKGGHILTNVYGGNEQTDVEGNCTINMSGGTVGVPRTVEDMQAHPVTCYVFGAGKGDPRINFNTWTNVDSVTVNITGGRIFGSVFGGGEDGHVLNDVKLTINQDSATTKIGTTGTSYVDGNVFGGGRGFSGNAQTAGTVGGNVEVNIESGTMLGSIYGGGRLASVGTLFTAPDDPNYGNFVEDDTIRTYGHVTVNISGGTIGNDIEHRHNNIEFTITGTPTEEAKKERLQALKDNDTIPNTIFELYDTAKISDNEYKYKYRIAHTTGGNVFGGSMGRLDLLNGNRNPIWPRMAQVKSTVVNISGAVIKSNVYGGGELGTVRDSALVNISAGIIRRDVYGGGYGSEDTLYTIFTVKEPNKPNPTTLSDYDDHTYAFKPMQFAGCVGIRTRVNITDGYIRKSVYGGGEMASVGIINCLVDSMPSVPGKDKIVVGQSNSQYYYYSYMTRHGDDATTFALSWPYEFNYMPGFDGETHIKITGGRIGLKTDGDIDDINTDNGDVYGGGKGIAGDYKDYIFCANVGSTDIYIDIPTIDPASYETGGNCIAGAVYGGAENGHVMDSTYIILKNGLIGHALYGGGSGKGQFSTKLLKIGANENSQNEEDYYTRSIYSITAGKVFGNTRIDMSGGYVVRNVYGGGTLGSVGKGNYAGAKDDYSYYEASNMTYNGYGEALLDDSLWSNDNKFSQAFLSSGICTVNITGGTVGYIKDSHSTKDGLPYGNVFGGCRGASAPNITETPRYLYAPEAFLGYANETHVTIGTPGQSSDNAGQAGNAPRIYGSVYGGGQDGHVRRDAFVTIYSGVIGSTFIADSLNDDMWLHSGNVYGAGSGIGKYKYDFTYDNDYNDTVTYNHSRTAEEDYSTSAGSVTRYTKVEIQGGIIHRNVYGGGSLASIGAPKFPIERTDGDPISRNEVIISGGQIGDVESHHNSNHNYGGNVFGASRGQEGLGERYSSSVSTSVNISDTTSITGSVYGGGEIGAVKQGVDVNISGGTINHDVYGGGALASTNTSVTTVSGKSIYPTTTVNVTGGRMHNIYGGGLGSLGIDNEHDSIISDVEAFSGNVIVNLNSHYAEADTVGAIVDSIFGANNLNGTPLGHIKVHVFATQNASKATIEQKYPKRPVMGEKGHEDETQQAFLQRLIDSLTVSTTPITYLDKVDSQVLANAQSIHDKYADALISTSVTQAQKDSLLRVMNDSINAVQQQYARLYDVAVVFGGGNLAPYIPANVDSAEVIIDGCGATSICQVYGGGNAASVPSTYVVVNGTYEIDEVFGGGNGNDPYVLLGKTFENPGANVGYYNYTYFVKDNTTGRYKPVDKPNARTREDRAQYYSYEKGTGVATTQIRGGKVHTVYGGSNEKGNIRTTALSVYDNAIDDCPIEVDETYGGGKNASMDGKIVISLDCVKDMDMMFGGAMNADINNDIILNVTNGTFKRIFGGNNEGGAINGSITINIEEKGCQPIVIDELYGGGYLAPYSIYGYETNATTGEYNYYLVDEDNKFVRENGHYVLSDSINGKLMPLDTIPDGSQIKPSNDPRINIISATRIGNIYGGGYKAKMVGSPYINVNMQEGKMDVKKKIDYIEEEDTIYKYVDVFNRTYQRSDLDTEIVNGDSTFYSTIALGTLGYIFGGGYEADVVGDTHIDIGTGEWLNDSLQREMIGYTNDIDTTTFTYNTETDKWSYIDGDDTLIIVDKPTPVRNAAVITGNIFGGGDNADINGNTNINIANGHIYFNVYGGGRMGSVGTITDSIKHDMTINEFGSEIAHEFDISWPYQFTYKDGTGSTNITITGGRIGFSGKDNFKKNDSYSYWEHSSIKKDDLKDGEERLDNGDVYGGGQGIAAKRYTEAHIANVKDTRIIVDYNSTPAKNVAKSFDKDDIQGCITGGLYGGGENGHVYDSTYITINNGIIGHNVYGGGKGKDGYSDVILKWKTLEDQIDNLYFKTVGNQKVMKEMSEIDDYYKDTVTVNSIIAGKVYGNTRIEMNGGWVIRNIYGGGNLASVGIGNYASGTDDYYTNGYGERIYNKLFDAADNDSSRWFLNSGIATVIIKSGSVGTFNGIREEEFLPYGNVFGGCRGIAVPNVPRNLTPRIKYCPENFLGFVNESKVVIGDSTTAPRIYGSVYGGGQDGHLRRWTDVTINSGEIGNAYTLENFATILADNRDKTTNEFKIDSLEYDKMQWLGRGNVYGAGSGIGTYSEQYIGTSDKTGNDTILSREMHSSSSGSVTRSTNVTVNGGKIHRNVYAGGSLATIGPPTIPPVLWDADSAWSCNYLTINGGEIGDTLGYSLGYGGNVYGASRGGERFAYEDSASYITTFATTIYTKLDINGGYINGSVFGGGEAGLVKQNSTVNMNGSTTESAIIFRDLYGGGDQADVKGNTSVNISGGWIKKNVYGGGNMGSIGTLIGTPEIHDSIKNPDQGVVKGPGALYAFGLSWPVKLQYKEGTGTTHVNVSGGRIGVTGKDYMMKYTELTRNDTLVSVITGQDSIVTVITDTLNAFGVRITSQQFKDAREDNGDIYGGSKGTTADRYEEAYLANVNNTVVKIDYPTSVVNPTFDNISNYIKVKKDKITIKEDVQGIHGSVYGGGENGHVLDSTILILNNGIIGHGMYGGGKGKDTYTGQLINYFTRTPYITQVASITSGKVYGNTNVTMNGGYVLRNIYGGGNLASVGKGNYSGGTDDYSLEGYGELPPLTTGGDEGPLWANDDFMNSGICRVTINGGTVGYFNSSHDNMEAFIKDNLPTGNVFGSCRGQAAPAYNDVSPRYLYFPEFFYGYVNQTIVTIGDSIGDGPRILGSVYGGGQDGHVRRGSVVNINNGTIGLDYNQFASNIGDDGINASQFRNRGNVLGAGSGYGIYSYDTRKPDPTDNTKTIIETGYNNSSGSVTCTTTININDGTIYQNVYGGGALASVGAPNIGPDHALGFPELSTTTELYERPSAYSQYNSHGSSSLNNIIINGGTIGSQNGVDNKYGGNVYGASRGEAAMGARFATSIWTKVEAKNGHIFGNVFGGGESGAVTMDTYVELGGKVVESQSRSGSGAPRRAAPVVQPSAAAPAANVNTGTGSNTRTPANVATEAPDARSIRTNRANQ